MAHVRFAIHERPAATVSARIAVADGRISAARLAVGSVGVLPVLVPDVGETLEGEAVATLDAGVLAAVGERAAEVAEPVADANGGQDYKQALVRTLAVRALQDAATRASARAEAR
jgi:CO/xanthine dehydrogenase FAD-binding subunit